MSFVLLVLLVLGIHQLSAISVTSVIHQLSAASVISVLLVLISCI